MPARRSTSALNVSHAPRSGYIWFRVLRSVQLPQSRWVVTAASATASVCSSGGSRTRWRYGRRFSCYRAQWTGTATSRLKAPNAVFGNRHESSCHWRAGRYRSAAGSLPWFKLTRQVGLAEDRLFIGGRDFSDQAGSPHSARARQEVLEIFFAHSYASACSSDSYGFGCRARYSSCRWRSPARPANGCSIWCTSDVLLQGMPWNWKV